MEMKDMIVIKNLPSNIVEEAWVVIKPEVRNKIKYIYLNILQFELSFFLLICSYI